MNLVSGSPDGAALQLGPVADEAASALLRTTSGGRLWVDILDEVAALKLVGAAVDLPLALDHLPVADAPDAQPAHVFGIRYSGN